MIAADLWQEWLYCGKSNLWQERFDFIKKYLISDRLKIAFSFNCVKSIKIDRDSSSRIINIIKITEKYLDEKVSQEEIENANNLASEIWDEDEESITVFAYLIALIRSLLGQNNVNPFAVISNISLMANWAAPNQKEYQANILIKLLRPEWEFNPNWLTEVTKSLATRINDEKRYDLTPILADALEDCGCDNQELLEYLRDSDELIKGDWVIDHLLGKR